MILTIRGKRWRILFQKAGLGAGNIGHCDPPVTPNKAIIIKPGLSEDHELDTVVHEILHASHWDLSEDAIAETASDIARALIKLGWKKT